MKRGLLLITSLVFLIILINIISADYSQLWGVNGELWTPQSRLPDFSYAGYHAGEAPLPNLPNVKNVKTDFGAVGDGVADDTDEFKAAIAATNNGALYVPAGTYKITDILDIRKNNFVLRGAGPDKTILYFPYHLEQMTGLAHNESSFRYGVGGVIWIGEHTASHSGGGSSAGGIITSVSGEYSRGDKVISVSNAANINPGDFVVLTIVDTGQTGSFGHYLHSYLLLPGAENYKNKTVTFKWPVQVVAKSGNQITLKQPLRFDIKQSWNPEIRYHSPKAQEVGVEDLKVKFPDLRYKGGTAENGYNAFSFTSVLNGWLKNVHMQNADNGVSLKGATKHVTMINTVHIPRSSGNLKQGNHSYDNDLYFTGHHAYSFGGDSNDNLLTNFDNGVAGWSDAATVSNYANGNVIGYGKMLGGMDHHRIAPFENLYSNIDTVIGRKLVMYHSGGDSNRGPHTGDRATFWNNYADGSEGWTRHAPVPDNDLGSGRQINVISINPSNEKLTATKEWYEYVPNLQPEDIYQAQLAYRLGNPPPQPQCPDGTCNGDETCSTCSSDCGDCPITPICGDNNCDLNEDCSSCSSDCSCSSGYFCSAGQCIEESFCGDETCDQNEDCNSCSQDCGQCSSCGDGICNGNETCLSCETDCRACQSQCGSEDVNSDNKINIIDLALVSFWKNKGNFYTSLDTNNDGFLNAQDLNNIKNRFRQC